MNRLSKSSSDALTRIAEAMRRRQYKQAEEAASLLLLGSPLLAQAWVYLGEALLQQRFGAAARAALNRAWLLDPRATWAETMKQALDQAPPGPDAPYMGRLLEVKPVTVAAAIMTFNEARCIERCILSLLGAVDEILVVDSGSTDGTLDIVHRYPQVKVLRDVPLNDDFSWKRNQGLQHVESDWVLWVDADEWLEPEDVPCVREAAGLFDASSVPPVLLICQVNRVGQRVSYEYTVPRLFPVRRGIRYYGKVHEQVVIEGKRWFEGGFLQHSVRIRLHHDGYEPDVMEQRGKLERNMKLLEQMVSEEPDNPGWLLFYGRETLRAGDPVKAERILLDAEEKAAAERRFGRILDIQQLLLKIYIARKQLDQAEAVCLRSLERHPDYPDTLFWLGQIRRRKAFELLKQSELDTRKAKSSFQSYRGMVSADRSILEWKADAALADLALMSGKPERAVELYEQILQKHPGLTEVKKKLDRLAVKDAKDAKDAAEERTPAKR